MSRQNREIDEELDEDYVEERSPLDRIKTNRDVEGGREALGMGICNINIWDGSELELAWSKKSSSDFKNSCPIFLLYFESINF